MLPQLETEAADVVIIGGGPVGSLLAYQIAHFGCKPCVIEQDDKTQMPCYGRACTMWPRTLELLDQLELSEPLIQAGVVTRSGLHFHEGHRVKGGLMYGSRMDKLGDTFFKFALHLRQRLIEEKFTEVTSEEYGIQPRMLHRIEGYIIDENDSYPVRVQVKHLETEKVHEIKWAGNLPFANWPISHLRVNTLKAAGFEWMHSASHGQILWCPIDNGMTRIGYVFSAALMEKYGGVEGVTQEVAMTEAKQALYPFEMEFVKVDWFTIYGIGQRIASTFCANERVFLAGDACHTHSSGSAQGLNTGVHDAVNLAWKLALRIQGFAKKELLDTYDSERRQIVQTVIDNDKVISTLISGHYPPRFQGRSELPREILTEWFNDINMQYFTLGLGISYPSSFLNSNIPGPSRATIDPGERGPDVYLTTLGTGDPIRLQKILSNRAKFSIAIFAGNPQHTRPALLELRIALSNPESFVNVFPKQAFQWFTIPAAFGNGGQEVLGCQPFGKVYLDGDVKAHEMYGVDIQQGAMIVFRPDGWIGAVVPLQGTEQLKTYFDGILIAIS